jgi:hypothetical protein
VFFGVCVAGGGVGAEGRGRGDQLPGDCGECWSVEEFGAGGRGVVGAEKIDSSEQSECDGDTLLFGALSVEKGATSGEDKKREGSRMNFAEGTINRAPTNAVGGEMRLGRRCSASLAECERRCR